MMENNTELTGQLVLVHPELSDDPAERQNTIGIITFADLSMDDFYVGFQDNTTGRYASNALLILKPMDEIHQLLVDRGDLLSFPDLKALTHLDLTLRYATGDRTWSALQLAANNPAIQTLCLDVLNDTIAIQQAHNRKR